MIALDYTVIIQIIAFLFLWFFLARLLFRPFIGLVEERERRTEGVKAEAASLMEEGERLRAEYENRIIIARDEGRQAKEGIVQEARQERERLLAKSREEATKMLDSVQADVQREMEKARQFAAEEAQVIAQQMAAKIVGRQIG